MEKGKKYVKDVELTEEQAQEIIEKLKKVFPIGSVIVVTFDTRRCVFRINKYIYDEMRETVATIGDGLNSANELKLNSPFGLKRNYIRLATEEERNELLKQIKEQIDTLLTTK